MRWAVLVLFAGCTSVDPEEPIASTRQAFSATPQFAGPTTGARLGASMTTCPGSTPFFVAGAPGIGTVLLTSDAGSPAPLGNQLGRAVACGSEVFAAGANGVDHSVGGTWFNLTTGATVALALSDFDGTLPLLVGQPPAVHFTNQMTGGDVGPALLNPMSSFGSALAWSPSSQTFAVGSPGQQQVDVYNYANGSPFSLRTLSEPRLGFGRAITFGNISPYTGTEIIIGAEGAIFVYGEDGVFQYSKIIQSVGFGASLAIEFDAVLGLDALWVGDPIVGKVYRLFGASSAVFIGPPAIRFGESIGVADTVVAVGAPDFPSAADGRGAIFLQTLSTGTNPGEPQLCGAVGQSCITSGCVQGLCQGGVFCATSGTSACASDDLCVNGSCVMPDGGLYPDAGVADAGVSDAGVPDAGISDAGSSDAGSSDAGVPDAGVPDAGVPDAGVPDAGVSDAGAPDAGAPDAGLSDAGVPDAREPELVAFVSSCSTGGAWPLVLGALVLLRRRRL